MAKKTKEIKPDLTQPDARRPFNASFSGKGVSKEHQKELGEQIKQAEADRKKNQEASEDATN